MGKGLRSQARAPAPGGHEGPEGRPLLGRAGADPHGALHAVRLGAGRGERSRLQLLLK